MRREVKLGTSDNEKLQCALQLIAVRFSVLQYVQRVHHAVEFGMLDSKKLQYAAVCCSMLQYVAVCCSTLQYVAMCCNVLQCVAVCCSVLQCIAVRCSVLHLPECPQVPPAIIP